MWKYAVFKFETLANSMGYSKETLRKLFIIDKLAINVSDYGERVCFRALGEVSSYFNPSKIVKDIYPFSTLARITVKSKLGLDTKDKENTTLTIARLSNNLTSPVHINSVHGNKKSTCLNLDVNFISYKERIYTILLSTIQLLYVKYS